MVKKNVIFVSDFEIDSHGDPMTGYSDIACSYGKHLSKYFNIIGFGISYRRNQHKMPFNITLVHRHQISNAIHSLFQGTKKEINKVMIFLDVNMLGSFINSLKPPADMKVGGVFAVEADPLIFSWAAELMKYNKRYCISQFGVDECKKSYIDDVKHSVVPIDQTVWKKRTNEEYLSVREQLGLNDKKVFFINADNNERKNISVQLEGFRLALEKNSNLHMLLLTRLSSPVGWDFKDIQNRLKLNNNLTLIDRGLPKEEVRRLYVASDYLLNLSKAEGLGMSILEAQSVGVPVVGTNCTAMVENINDGRGYLLNSDYVYPADVFGNTRRYYIFENTIMDNILKLAELNSNDNLDIVEKSWESIEKRNKEFITSVEDMKEFING